MSKILMITSRNIVDHEGNTTGVGAATLIFRRGTEIYKIFGIKTYILPINGNVRDHNTGHIGCDFVFYKNLSIKDSITRFIKDCKPEVIIYSGDKSYFYDKHVRKLLKLERLKSHILIDLHGALEEGIEYQTGLSLIISYFRYRVKTLVFKRTAKNVNGFLVVSDELKEHHLRLLPHNVFYKDILKIRCGVNEVVSNELRFKWRKEIRRLLGLNDDTIVFVYSGYRAKWQCIDEIIKNFKEIDSIRDNVFFILLTKTDESFETFLRETFPKHNYFAGLVPSNQLFKYLSACDVGMLIRHNNYTNKVAFPNKFSDYINAGLMLAISPSLHEPARLLENYNIPYMKINPGDRFPDDFSIIDYRRNNLVNYYDMCNMLCTCEILYSSQINNQYEEFCRVLKINNEEKAGI